MAKAAAKKNIAAKRGRRTLFGIPVPDFSALSGLLRRKPSEKNKNDKDGGDETPVDVFVEVMPVHKD